MIGGLERPDGGAVRIDGVDVTAVPAHRRPTHMVFQHYALFPHLTVAENVAFGFRYRPYPLREHGRRVAEALALVRLAGLERRYPGQLSGGQRQRVALARALALEPRVLLLDEPLGALDQKLRQEMQVELKELQRKLGITFVFVTHDQEEALLLGDRLAVMNAGRVEQVGEPATLFERPRTAFVAEFMGAGNFFTATAEPVGDGAVELSLADGQRFALPATATPPPAGGGVCFVVRPERLTLRGRDGSPRPAPSLPVTVEERVYRGASTTWIVRTAAGERMVVSGPEDATIAAGGLRAGDLAWLCWSPRHVVLVDEEAGGG
jgi:spermidine/putrescine transport system ATP-binding protein